MRRIVVERTSAPAPQHRAPAIRDAWALTRGDQAGQLFLDDDPAVLLGLHHAAPFEVLHHPADHLARRADDLGQVLARDLVADDLELAVHLGHVEQRAGDPAVDVEQRERFDLPVGGAQAVHQAAHDRVREARVLGQAARELGAAEDQHVGLHLGADRRRVRLVVDQAHLADVVARLQHREDDLAAARVGRQHAGAAGQQDVERIRLLAVLDDDLSAPEPPLDDAVGNALRLVVGQQREQRNAPDEVEIREHGHLKLPFWLRAAAAAAGGEISRFRAVTLLSPLPALTPAGIAPHVRLARRCHTLDLRRRP